MEILYTIICIFGISFGIMWLLIQYVTWYHDSSACTQDCEQGRHCTCGKKQQ